MNPAAEKLFGWSFQELRGKKMHAMTHHHHPDGTPFPAEECAGLQVLAQGKMLTDHEDIFIRKDGTFFDVIYSSSPLRSGSEITGLVVVFRNVTERKQALALVMAQKQAFETFTAGTPLIEVLEVLAHAVEGQSHPGAVVAIHLLDESGRRTSRLPTYRCRLRRSRFRFRPSALTVVIEKNPQTCDLAHQPGIKTGPETAGIRWPFLKNVNLAVHSVDARP